MTELTSRVHLLAPTITWRIEDEALVHEKNPGSKRAKRTVLPIHDLQEVRLWRAMGVINMGVSMGGHLEARLRVAGRWWAMSGHHAVGPAQVVDRSKDLIFVLHSAIRRRQAIGDGLICRSGSGGQMVAAILLFVLVLAIIVVFTVGFTLKGLPPSPWIKLITLGGVLASLLALAIYLARSGRRRTMSVAEFLDYNGERAFHFRSR